MSEDIQQRSHTRKAYRKVRKHGWNKSHISFLQRASRTVGDANGPSEIFWRWRVARRSVHIIVVSPLRNVTAFPSRSTKTSVSKKLIPLLFYGFISDSYRKRAKRQAAHSEAPRRRLVARANVISMWSLLFHIAIRRWCMKKQVLVQLSDASTASKGNRKNAASNRHLSMLPTAVVRHTLSY